MMFSYKINDKLYKVNEITFNDLKKIQLLIELNDNYQIDDYINTLFDNKQINIIKKFILLLYSYSINVKDLVTFTLKEESEENDKTSTFNLYITDIINQLLKIDIEDEIIKLNKNSYIIIGLPNDFFFYNKETINEDFEQYNTYNYIKKIVIDNEECDIKKEYIDNFPSAILHPINKKIKEWNNILHNISLYNDEFPQINCNPITLFEYIKKILSIDYTYLISIEYNLFRYIRINNYFDITLKEAELLLRKYEIDMEDQQNALKNQKGDGPTIS